METALYYLFSTAAQTLAAAVGFLAAFVLLRLQHWDTQIEEANRGYDELAPKSAELTYRLACAGKYDDAKQLLTQIWQQQYRISFPAPLLDAIRVFSSLHPKRDTLLRNFRIALAWSAVTVTGCLVCIPFSRSISTELSWLFACVVVAACIVCGCAFWNLIRGAVTIDQPKKSQPTETAQALVVQQAAKTDGAAESAPPLK